jgi:hypothetical protein
VPRAARCTSLHARRAESAGKSVDAAACARVTRLSSLLTLTAQRGQGCSLYPTLQAAGAVSGTGRPVGGSQASAGRRRLGDLAPAGACKARVPPLPHAPHSAARPQIAPRPGLAGPLQRRSWQHSSTHSMFRLELGHLRKQSSARKGPCQVFAVQVWGCPSFCSLAARPSTMLAVCLDKAATSP